MSARTRAIMQALTQVAERPTWDEPPALYRIAEGDRVMRLIDLGIEPLVWVGQDVQTVLTGLATVLVAGGYQPRPGDPLGQFVGMAFRSEANYVETEADDALGMHVMSKMAGEGRLREHPGRVEVRIVIAVDRHGVTYEAKHTRGGETEQLMALPGRDDLQMGGAIVECLDVMVAALAGVTPPPRPSAYATTTEGSN